MYQRGDYPLAHLSLPLLLNPAIKVCARPQYLTTRLKLLLGKIVALGAVLGGLLLATQYKKYNTAYAQDNVQEVVCVIMELDVVSLYFRQY